MLASRRTAPARLAFFKYPMMRVFVRLAPLRSAFSMMVANRLAPSRFAPCRLARRSTVPSRFAWRRSASVSTPSVKSQLKKSVLTALAPASRVRVIFARRKLIPLRSSPVISAPVKSGGVFSVAAAILALTSATVRRPAGAGAWQAPGPTPRTRAAAMTAGAKRATMGGRSGVREEARKATGPPGGRLPPRLCAGRPRGGGRVGEGQQRDTKGAEDPVELVPVLVDEGLQAVTQRLVPPPRRHRDAEREGDPGFRVGKDGIHHQRGLHFGPEVPRDRPPDDGDVDLLVRHRVDDGPGRVDVAEEGREAHQIADDPVALECFGRRRGVAVRAYHVDADPQVLEYGVVERGDVEPAVLPIHEDVGGAVVGPGGGDDVDAFGRTDLDVTIETVEPAHEVAEALPPPDVLELGVPRVRDELGDLVLHALVQRIGDGEVVRVGAHP